MITRNPAPISNSRVAVVVVSATTGKVPDAFDYSLGIAGARSTASRRPAGESSTARNAQASPVNQDALRYVVICAGFVKV